MVRQLTLRDHADGDEFWWVHKHLLVNSGILPQNFSVVGIFADDWLLVKYANPAMALQAVWGLPDLIIAWCTYRTHPHATLVALRTDRPPRPTPGCVGCSAHVLKARSRKDPLANLDHRHRLRSLDRLRLTAGSTNRVAQRCAPDCGPPVWPHSRQCLRRSADWPYSRLPDSRWPGQCWHRSPSRLPSTQTGSP